MRLSDSSMLTDKSGSGVLLYLHSGRTDCDRKYVWTAKARRRSRLFVCFADGSEVCCVLDGWVCSLCVCTVYIGHDCQTLSMETARVHGWVQEMTMIMPNVPFASASFVVIYMVCNRVRTWPHCFQSSAFVFPWVTVAKPPKLNIHYLSALTSWPILINFWFLFSTN